MNYEESIAAHEFGMVERCLADPQGRIEIVLHVKSRSLLVRVVEMLDTTVSPTGDTGGPAATRVLDDLMARGSLRLTVREKVAARYGRYSIAASSIPTSAPCEAIYFPPFYVVHTPGLFEGKLALLTPHYGAEFHPDSDAGETSGALADKAAIPSMTARLDPVFAGLPADLPDNVLNSLI